MSFSTNGSGQQQAEINVTPLIDVLLVLLIIFMVTVPQLPPGVRATVPESALSTPVTAQETPIVLQVSSAVDGTAMYSVNEQPVAANRLVEQLHGLLLMRQDRQMFVKGGRELEFAKVAEAISLAHLASAEQVGILTPKDEASR